MESPEPIHISPGAMQRICEILLEVAQDRDIDDYTPYPRPMLKFMKRFLRNNGIRVEGED